MRQEHEQDKLELKLEMSHRKSSQRSLESIDGSKEQSQRYLGSKRNSAESVLQEGSQNASKERSASQAKVRDENGIFEQSKHISDHKMVNTRSFKLQKNQQSLSLSKDKGDQPLSKRLLTLQGDSIDKIQMSANS